MSLHPSLRVDSAGAQQRTVLTRIERIKDLMKKSLWSDEKGVTGLPKTKILRIKSKKTKAKAEGEAEGAVEGAAPDAKPAEA